MVMLELELSRYMSGKWPQDEMQWREVTMEKEKGKGHSGSHTACDSHRGEWNCLEHITRIYVGVKEWIWTIQYLSWVSGDLLSVRDGIVSQEW